MVNLRMVNSSSELQFWVKKYIFCIKCMKKMYQKHSDHSFIAYVDTRYVCIFEESVNKGQRAPAMAGAPNRIWNIRKQVMPKVDYSCIHFRIVCFLSFSGARCIERNT